MTWLYCISSGEIYQDRNLIGVGYSGHADYKNDPTATDKPDIGPIPVGNYSIGSPFTHPITGPLSMRLAPEPENNMHGRAGFLIHGDSLSNPGTASNGCIILARPIRLQIIESDDNDLTVIA